MKTSTQRCSRLNWRTFIAGGFKTFLVLFLLSLLTPGLQAQVITVNGQPSDWCQPGILTSPKFNYVRDALNLIGDDTEFNQGTSDVLPISDWHWGVGNVGDKADLGNTGIYIQDACQIYFYTDRFAANGDADLGLWLFKDPVSLNPDGTFSGVHTDGDLLFTSKFTNGGGNQFVRLYEWQGDALTGSLVLIYDSEEDTGKENDLIGVVNNSTLSVPSCMDYTGKTSSDYVSGTFFEGYINVCAFSDFGLDACFTNYIFKTSQSQEPTSANGDLVFGEINSLPALKTLNGGSYCAGDAGFNITLSDADAGVSYQLQKQNGLNWDNTGAPKTVANDGDNIDFDGVQTEGNYRVMATTVGSNCSRVVGTATVSITPAPNANAGADKELTCTTTSIMLSGSSTNPSPPATFSWVASNGGNIVSNANTATPTVNAAGTYTLTVTADGCSATDVALVTLNNTAPNADAGADQELTCTTTSIMLSGSSTTAGATFSWVASNGGNITANANTATPTVNAAGTYTLTVTDPGNGCTATDVALVTLDNTAPNANAGADKELTCTTTSIMLSGSSTTAGVSYAWVASNGGNITANANTATPTVNAAGTYTLTVTDPGNGCTATDVALVTLNNTAPNANAGADKELTCTTTSIMLSGSSTTVGATFSWVASNGGNITANANTATPTVNAAGTYTLTVTDPGNGCTATDVALVTLNNTAPNANAGADKELTCTTTSIMLSGSSTTAGVSYAWVASNGGNITANANTATPTVNAAGTYTLTVTDPGNGCTATDVALVTLDNSLPNANAGADKELTCTTTSINLSGSSTTAGATFSWVASNGGNITANANTATPTVNAAGTYTLTVTDPGNGCTATDVALVTLNNTAPNANAGADKELTCTTISIMLSGSSTTAGVSYAWVASNGGNITANANTATPTVNAAGTYTLTVTDPGNGCTATDVALVTLNNTPPNANAGADKELTCTTISIMLSGSSTTAGATFSWVASNGGNITANANTATPTVNAAGTYTLTVTNPANGCTATDVALVTLNNTPPNVSAGVDKEIPCGSSTVMLSGSSTTAGATFSWVASNGGNIVSNANTATPTVNAAGTYTLTVTNPANGCTATDIALVTIGVCPEVFCTYTQGYFGNAGGKACDGETGGLSTIQLINQSISNWGGSILIGEGTRSVTINTGDAQHVINYLPGGGQSYALSAPAIGISSGSFASLYTKTAGGKTKINNTLLAQTITLGLNLGINDDLASFSFASHSAVNKYLVTQEPESCGSTVGVPDSYTCDEINVAVVALLKQANWPAGMDYPATVAGLFQLANYALGGGSLAGTGVTLNSIAEAADAINNAFDECRLFVGFRETCPASPTTKVNTEELLENAVSVTAFPNPYTDRVRFVLTATISGQGALEIYNSMGQRVATPFRGHMNAGTSQVVEYTVPANKRENLFYLLRVNDKQASGKLLNLD